MRPWSIGVDIVEVDRFLALDYSHHKQFYERWFTPREIEYCLSFKKSAAHFAANFAGKEAVYKAMNRFYDIKLRDIEILRDKKGPSVNLYPQKATKSRNYEEHFLWDIKVSLSHSSSYAVAFALISSCARDRS